MIDSASQTTISSEFPRLDRKNRNRDEKYAAIVPALPGLISPKESRTAHSARNRSVLLSVLCVCARCRLEIFGGSARGSSTVTKKAATMADRSSTSTGSGKKKKNNNARDDDDGTSKGGKYRTLGSLLRHFEGVDGVRIELKTGKIYGGTLSSIDASMNATLENVTSSSSPPSPRKPRPLPAPTNDDPACAAAASNNERQESPQPPPKLMSTVSIRGSLIRYVHLPDDVDPAAAVERGRERERAAANKYRRGVRRK